MERKQFDGKHQYLATPGEYPISDNNRPATYDQFIQLRDTLIFSGKQYSEHPGKKLIVGYKKDGSTTQTVEVQEREFFRQSFEPGYQEAAGDKIQTMILGDYITEHATGYPQGLVCTINRKGWYRIVHKEEILLKPETNKVCCYVDILRKNKQGEYVYPYKGGVAVFDWEGGREDENTHYKKTFPIVNGSISGTCHGEGGGDVDGSCSGNVVVQFTLGEIIQKMTAFGYMERELLEGDILLLRLKDKGANEDTGEPQGNDLDIQQFSNYRSVEYLDLSYNDL